MSCDPCGPDYPGLLTVICAAILFFLQGLAVPRWAPRNRQLYAALVAVGTVPLTGLSLVAFGDALSIWVTEDLSGFAWDIVPAVSLAVLGSLLQRRQLRAASNSALPFRERARRDLVRNEGL